MRVQGAERGSCVLSYPGDCEQGTRARVVFLLERVGSGSEEGRKRERDRETEGQGGRSVMGLAGRPRGRDLCRDGPNVVRAESEGAIEGERGRESAGRPCLVVEGDCWEGENSSVLCVVRWSCSLPRKLHPERAR